MQGIPFSYTFELRDNGTFGFELPEDQIQPTCEEAYRGAMHIITHAHDKTFNSAVAAAAATMWTMLIALCVTGTNVLWGGENMTLNIRLQVKLRFQNLMLASCFQCHNSFKV